MQGSVGTLSRLSCYLYGCAKLLVAEAAHKRPPTAGDVGHLRDGLHLLGAADAHLQADRARQSGRGHQTGARTGETSGCVPSPRLSYQGVPRGALS